MASTDHIASTSDTPAFRVSRRSFLRAAGVGAAGATFATEGSFGAVAFQDSLAAAKGQWDEVADIVVVGSGAAAFIAAVMGANPGNEVVMLEKGMHEGGTTLKSSGGYWIPNNAKMRADGRTVPREDTLKYMARYSYPQYYDPDDPQLGLFPNDYALIEAYYDNGYVMLDTLTEIGAVLDYGMGYWNDYQSALPMHKAGPGRALFTRSPEGEPTNGAGLIKQLKAFTDAHDVPILFEHRVERVVQDDEGQVIGVEATVAGDKTAAIRARKAVIFGSGGFTHDKWMMLHYQRGPMFGGCAVPMNEGDMVRIAGAVGAKLGNMTGAFHSQLLLEQALEYSAVPNDVFMHYGDSGIQVNKYGFRVVDEKSNYNDRTQIHFNWDPLRAEWPNELLFWIYDQRTADYWPGFFPIPASGAKAPYLITGQTLEELTANIDARLGELASQTGGARLDEAFEWNLNGTIGRFNEFARTGHDLDFHRGEQSYDLDAPSLPPADPDIEWPSPDQPNKTMYPISDEGPYYALILGAGSMTTNGGPVVNPKAQIVNVHDEVIPGLYGAGSCVAAMGASAYWGGGATVGNAMVLGYLAGVNADKEPVKES